MRMNIQPRVVGERIDYITGKVYMQGPSWVRSISLMPIRQSSFVRLSKE